MKNVFPTKENIGEHDVAHGMRMLVFDGVCSQVMGVFTTGAFLAAYALLIGASNWVIGLIAAIGPMTQMLQIPAIYLVNRSGSRRGVVVVSSILGRAFWFVIAGLPFLVPESLRVPVLLVSLFCFFGFGAVSGCAWNSWVRDLIPDRTRGSYFGNRQAVATAVGALLSFGAGFGVDHYKRLHPESEIHAYSGIILIGAIFGLLGIFFLWRTPEPPMAAAPDTALLDLLKQPLAEANYRSLLLFLASWNFAVNLGAPFFSIYMLQRLGMNMSWIIGLAVLSQVVNVIFFRLWGLAADRFSNKSVLAVSGPMFLFGFLLWPFTAMPEKHAFTIPILVLIHALAGISTAGVTLCTGTIAAKMAPPGKATAFLATNALFCGIAATAAPLLGGVLADVLNDWDLTLTASLMQTSLNHRVFDISAFNLRGLDFLFVASFLLGLYSIHRLLAVREEGEMGHGVVIRHFYDQARRSARAISNVAGLRALTAFPYQLLTRSSRRKKSKSKPAKDSPSADAQGETGGEPNE